MSDGVVRMLYNDEERPARPEVEAMHALDELVMTRRDSLIMELRSLERYLIERGKLKGESLPRRVR